MGPVSRADRWRLAVIALCIIGSMFGCATARPPLTVETPRELAPSQDHVFRAAVHPDTDLAGGGFVSGGDDAAGPVIVGQDAEAPDVQEKAAHGF